MLCELIVLLLFLAEECLIVGVASICSSVCLYSRLLAVTAAPPPCSLGPAASGLHLHFSMEPTLPRALITGVAGPPCSSGTILIYSCRPAVIILRVLFSLSKVSRLGQSILGPSRLPGPLGDPGPRLGCCQQYLCSRPPLPAELGPHFQALHASGFPPSSAAPVLAPLLFLPSAGPPGSLHSLTRGLTWAQGPKYHLRADGS